MSEVEDLIRLPSPLTQRLEHDMIGRFTDLCDDLSVIHLRFVRRQTFIIRENPVADQTRLRNLLERFDLALNKASAELQCIRDAIARGDK